MIRQGDCFSKDRAGRLVDDAFSWWRDGWGGWWGNAAGPPVGPTPASQTGFLGLDLGQGVGNRQLRWLVLSVDDMALCAVWSGQ
jgi:hypothetical protein